MHVGRERSLPCSMQVVEKRLHGVAAATARGHGFSYSATSAASSLACKYVARSLVSYEMAA
jgi:hypothetical protein